MNAPFKESALIQSATNNPDKILNIIIPAYNEAGVIAYVLKELDQILQALTLKCLIIIVDDGSTDETTKEVVCTRLETPLKLIRLSRNFGKEVAMSAGLEASSDADAVVIMDADGQHPPLLIKTFIQYWLQGAEDIYAVRENSGTDKGLIWLLRSLFYKFLPSDAQYIRSNAGDFRLLSAKVVKALNQLPEKKRFMKGLYSWVGFKKQAVPYTVRSRIAGKTKFTLRNLINFALTGITSFSTFPLRLISQIGFIISISSMIYGLFVFIETIVMGADLQGWPTLVVSIAFLSGIQLISIGILGEYIAQVFSEVKNRPLYFIEETIQKEGGGKDEE
jgi:glycosyltransferase involved in cell wall biosynthesis